MVIAIFRGCFNRYWCFASVCDIESVSYNIIYTCILDTIPLSACIYIPICLSCLYLSIFFLSTFIHSSICFKAEAHKTLSSPSLSRPDERCISVTTFFWLIFYIRFYHVCGSFRYRSTSDLCWRLALIPAAQGILIQSVSHSVHQSLCLSNYQWVVFYSHTHTSFQSTSLLVSQSVI